MTAGPLDTLPVEKEMILRYLGLNPKSPADQALVLMCQTVGLNPLLGHAVIIQNKLYVTERGLWHIAHRSGQLDGVEVDSELTEGDEYVARVKVYRKDMARPFPGTGRYPKAKKGTAGWRMARKNAFAEALRMAFDVELPLTGDDVDEPIAEPEEHPSLPDEPQLRPAPAAHTRGEPPALPDAATQRAQRMAILCRDAGIDDDVRHELIDHVTGGRTRTGKELTDEETGRLVALVTRHKRGETIDGLPDELRRRLEGVPA